MFCENCGAEYFGKQVFCEKCGHKLPDTDSSLDDNKDEQKALEPAIEPVSIENNQQSEPVPAVNNQQPQKNNGKRKKGIFGVIKFLFLEIIILGAMIYFLVPYIFDNFSAEHKAKQYFVAIVNEDYDIVY